MLVLFSNLGTGECIKNVISGGNRSDGHSYIGSSIGGISFNSYALAMA